jgi:hypothetical protein
MRGLEADATSATVREETSDGEGSQGKDEGRCDAIEVNRVSGKEGERDQSEREGAEDQEAKINWGNENQGGADAYEIHGSDDSQNPDKRTG